MPTKGRQTVLVVATGVCLCILAADRLLITPTVRAWEERTKRIRELRTAIASSESLLSQRGGWQDRRQALRTYMLPAIPSEAEDMVVKSVDRWARESGLQLTSLRPRLKTGGEARDLLEVNVAGTGPMASIARFLFELETAPLALAIEELDVSSRKQAGASLLLNLRLTGLLKTTEEERGRTEDS